jgi:hypothetical protein
MVNRINNMYIETTFERLHVDMLLRTELDNVMKTYVTTIYKSLISNFPDGGLETTTLDNLLSLFVRFLLTHGQRTDI